MRILTVFAATFAALVLVGCGGSGGGSLTPDPTLRYVNLVPDSTGLDFLVNSDTKASNLAYLDSSANFASLESRDYDYSFREHGTTEDLDITANTPSKDKDYVVLAIGQKGYGSEPLKRARVVVINVDRKMPNGNKARLYVVHAYSRAAGFDTPQIDFRNPGDNPQFSANGIDFAGSQALTVDSGNMTFQVRRNGTEEVYVNDTVLALGAGKVYLAIVAGIEGEVGAKAPQIKLIELQTKS